MIRLNLPPYAIRLKQDSGKHYVFDDLRQRFVRLTPEEWVRQHFVHYLIDHLGYPRELLMNEVPLQLGSLKKRSDTVLYDRQLQARMLVEYKAPSIRLSEAVLEQIIRYNYHFRVPYLILSNGLEHIAYHIDYASMTYRTLGEIPRYTDLT
ncbi:MAG: type I restriction enzyme HsdR N-terminal domain-containing protein [Porphyromonadaceae bacterium]|nr:type I restriction enzyme HsdR N-terminal domain-containing protein [Porphyromonadaceae bacterium]